MEPLQRYYAKSARAWVEEKIENSINDNGDLRTDNYDLLQTYTAIRTADALERIADCLEKIASAALGDGELIL